MARNLLGETDKAIGSKLKSARIDAGLSKSDVASTLRVSPQQLEKYEKGINRLSAKNLFILSALFEKPLEWFAEGLGIELQNIDTLYTQQNRFIQRMNKELRRVTNPKMQFKVHSLLRLFLD